MGITIAGLNLEKNILVGRLSGNKLFSEIMARPFIPPMMIRLSLLFVNNKEVSANDSSRILPRSLFATDHIKLKHYEN